MLVFIYRVGVAICHRYENRFFGNGISSNSHMSFSSDVSELVGIRSRE